MGRSNVRVQRAAIRTLLAALVCGGVTLFNAVTAAGQPHPTLVSVNNAGTGSGNFRSGDFNRYSLTRDGRYVVFYSEASDLVPLDASRNGDIFVRDLQLGTTTLVSVNAAGTASGNGISSFGLISDDGRYVAFTSFANNLVTNDTNTAPDVFLRDLQAGTTRLVSINVAGTASGALAGSDLIAITPDGRFVTFSSGANDLTLQTDVNGLATDVYVRDTVNNVTRLVSVNAVGTATGNRTSFGGSISGDGRYVVFTSEASDLVANDTDTRDVFLRDLQTGTTVRLSTNAAGNAGGNGASSAGIVDRGGRLVVFATRATDLSILPDTNNLSDIFVYDIQTGVKTLITVNFAGNATGSGLGPFASEHTVRYSISDNARFVAFMSQSGNLVTNDTNGSGDDIFRYEMATQAKSLVSVNFGGTSGTTGGSSNPSISATGRFIAFDSLANDLVSVADETNGLTSDVFVRDVVTGETFLASLNSAGTRTGNGFSFQPVISADGKRLVFHSRASNLITNDLNGVAEDVFTFTIDNGGPELLIDETTERAVALDSVTQTRDPFSLTNPFNFSADHRTRVSLFVWRLGLLPGDGISNVTAQAEDEQGRVYPLQVEFVGPAPGLNDVTQVVVKLPQVVSVPTDLLVRISLRSAVTNKAQIKIKA